MQAGKRLSEKKQISKKCAAKDRPLIHLKLNARSIFRCRWKNWRGLGLRKELDFFCKSRELYPDLKAISS